MQSVKERYAAAAQARQESLCCPVSYDPAYLKAIPEAVIERDYGCGDPSRHVREGDTVLDLGAGPAGRVIGVDMTDEMLALARASRAAVSENIGYDNVEIRHGHIQDLRTDLDLVDAYLQGTPLESASDYKRFEDFLDRIRREQPLVESDSIDLIISNCVLNLVPDHDKKALFEEMYRVLRVGGRIAVSDIVSDEASPAHFKDDAELWSGCLSGALQEYEFLRLLEETGFHGIEIAAYERAPWRVVEDIEYRSATFTAAKGKEGPCLEKNQAVIYKGPWKQVKDDDGHVYVRGQRMAVCAKTFAIMTKAPYGEAIIAVSPGEDVAGNETFDCSGPAVRPPAITKRGKPASAPSRGNGGSPCC